MRPQGIHHGASVLLWLGVLATLVSVPPRVTLLAQPSDGFGVEVLEELHWRNIGPHCASRTKALDGVPSQPHTFYVGAVNGGV